MLVLAIAVPSLVYAHTTNTAGGKVLTVYRSPIVRDDDERFSPVADILKSFDCTLLHEETNQDPDMYFGKGTLTSYLIQERHSDNS